MAITMRIVCAYETSRVVFPTDPPISPCIRLDDSYSSLIDANDVEGGGSLPPLVHFRRASSIPVG